jgi:hypothetical protein
MGLTYLSRRVPRLEELPRGEGNAHLECIRPMRAETPQGPVMDPPVFVLQAGFYAFRMQDPWLLSRSGWSATEAAP